jgi:hypothetical protein
MRLFQNSALYPSYFARLNLLAAKATRFAERRDIILDDRFGAAHVLKPVLDRSPEAFFTCGDDEILQRSWAREQGMPGEPTLETILLAQIEHHATEVFYNLDPVRYPSAFVAKLPGCVKTALCWRAAPSAGADFSAYGAVLCNFPSILEMWRRNGCRAEPFFPAHDPVMDEYGHGERPIDVVFVGGYSRHHRVRARTLEQVAQLAGQRNVVLCLDASRLTKLAESAIGRLLPPLRQHRRPDVIAAIARPPVFGRDLYELIGSAKIVLNGSIDIAGHERGNMRCFEAMGCGALLLSDAGQYPEGMDSTTIVTYETGLDCLEQIEACLTNPGEMAAKAAKGRRAVRDLYSKERQWALFARLLEQI